VKGAVAIAKDRIRPMLKVESFKTLVAQTDNSGLGGGTPPMVTIVVGIEEFSEEVAAFVSIAVCDTV
jgi:hypothetical protein